MRPDRVRANDERAAGENGRFFDKGWRSREDDRKARELLQPVVELQEVERRLVDVRDRKLERHRLMQPRGGKLGHPAMAGVERVEAPGKMSFVAGRPDGKWSHRLSSNSVQAAGASFSRREIGSLEDGLAGKSFAMPQASATACRMSCAATASSSARERWPLMSSTE